MAERAPPADPPGPQFMAEKLARLDADLHLLLDAAAPMREDCAARDPRAPAERLRHAHRLRPTSVLLVLGVVSDQIVCFCRKTAT